MVIIFANLLFLVAAVGVCILPLRFALLAYLFLVQFDISGAGWAPSSELGVTNTLTIILLPAMLCLRLRQSIRWPGRHPAMLLWALFLLYVSIAVFWSPYPASAIKMPFYFIGFVLMFVAFEALWRRAIISSKLVVASAWIVLGIAMIQTYLAGNPFGGVEGRFTSFASPQSFAGYLVICAALILVTWPEDASAVYRFITVGTMIAIGSGLAINGSRYAMASFLLLLAIWWLLAWSTAGQKIARQRLVTTLGLVMLITLAGVGILALTMPGNRLFELRETVSRNGINPLAVTNFASRETIYRLAIDDIADRDPLSLTFGSGTSSGAAINDRLDPAYFPPDLLSENRIFHNVFIRIIYEWGLVGGMLLVGFVFVSSRSLINNGLLGNSRALWIVWLVLPLFTLSLMLENVLASSGKPLGAGIILAVGFAAASAPATRPAAQLAAHDEPAVVPVDLVQQPGFSSGAMD